MLTQIILILGTYIFPINARSKKNHVIHRRMRKPRAFKFSRYASRVVEPNEYLTVFPVSYA